MHTWRDVLRPLVADALRRAAAQPPAQVRVALRAARPPALPPWARRVWADESARQLGAKPPVQRHGVGAADPRQLALPLG